jgi:hypothetical protein
LLKLLRPLLQEPKEEPINLYLQFKIALEEKNIAENYMNICDADYYDSAQRDFEAKESRMMAIWREIRRSKK